MASVLVIGHVLSVVTTHPTDARGDDPVRSADAGPARTWRLLDASGRAYDGPRPGTLGGHRRGRIYGRLDCPAALRAIARGGYVADRVFFADEPAAVGAGYRPCAVCLPERYAEWKARRPAAT
jgi:methylphosphotriester-DNA--protein-cysteine methyltransferase